MVVGAALGVLAALAWFSARGGGPSVYDLYYNVPIAAPFAAFLVERALAARRLASLLVDASVVSISLARVVFPVPGYSGHALFLFFAFATARGRALRILSGLVLAEVLFIKFALWGDFVTVGGSAVIGALAVLAARTAPVERSDAVSTRRSG